MGEQVVKSRQKLLAFVGLLLLAGGIGFVATRPAVEEPASDPVAAAKEPFDDDADISRPRPQITEPADRLLSSEITPQEKLVIWQRLLIDYQTLHRSLPTGSREEIFAALAGDNPRKVSYITPGHPALEQTDIFFHVISSQLVEPIHHGPDGAFFTDDDIALTPTNAESRTRR